MGKTFDKFLGGIGLRRTAAPGKTVGVPGTAIIGGFVDNREKNATLGSREQRYTAFSEILSNTSIVSAGIRYYLDLVGNAEWNFVPSEADTGGVFAELTKNALTKDPSTPFRRVVRRAAMYRLYGFSIQEWTAKRHEAGHLTFSDIAPRAQQTIDRWDFTGQNAEDNGHQIELSSVLKGVIQVSPQTSLDIYLPRGKIVYLVDDTLSDSPEGMGLFRHLVAPAQRLFRYEQLEGWGFENDLRGVPIGRAPFVEMARLENAGELTRAQRIEIEKPLRNFISNHIKVENIGLLMDSMPYESKGEDGTPSSTPQWSIELLQNSASSFAENAAAIKRLNMEMARVLGIEHLMLGGDSAGSFALSEDKTNRFHLLVDGALSEIRDTFESDLIDTLWRLNGWPDEMKPAATIEKIQFIDAAQVAGVLRELAVAGAPVISTDPVVKEIYAMMGLKSEPVERLETDLDDSLLDDDDDSKLTDDNAGDK